MRTGGWGFAIEAEGRGTPTLSATASLARPVPVVSGVRYHLDVWALAQPWGQRLERLVTQAQSAIGSKSGFLATASMLGEVAVWDPTTGHLLLSLDVDEAGVRDLAWLPDDRYLLTANHNRSGGWGIFDAPDPTVRLKVECSDPVVLRAYVQNLGAAQLPRDATVGFYRVVGDEETLIATAETSVSLFPGQVTELVFEAEVGADYGPADEYVAKLITDPAAPLFHDCREDNNASRLAQAQCIN